MPKLSRRKQSKPHHICSDDEEEDTPVKVTRSSVGKKAIADDNGNILSPRTRSGRSRDVKPVASKITKTPATRGRQRTCGKEDKKDSDNDVDVDEDDILASDDNSELSDNEQSGDDKEDVNFDDSADESEVKHPKCSDETMVKSVDEKENSTIHSKEKFEEEKSEDKIVDVESEDVKCDDNESCDYLDVTSSDNHEKEQNEEKMKEDRLKDAESDASEKQSVITEYKGEEAFLERDHENEFDEQKLENNSMSNIQTMKTAADLEEDGEEEMDEDSDEGELKIVENDEKDCDIDMDQPRQDRVQALIEDTPRGSSLQDRTCQYCDAVKKSPADLQRHLRKHTGERPFKCQLCNRMFKAKRSLQYHQFMHHGIQTKNSNISQKYSQMRKRKLEMDQLKAEISNKKIKVETGSVMDLTDGVVRRHDGKDSSTSPDSSADTDGSSDRVCQVCRKICLKPSDLKRHMMSHTGERPFKCDICGKPFRAKNSMLYHQKSAHGLDIELSPGLEERFLRLKKQNQLNTSGFTNNSQLYDASQTYPMDYDLDDIDSISDESSFLSRPVMCSTSRKNRLLYDLNTADEDDEIELDEATGLFKPRGSGFKLNEKQGPSMVGTEIIQESNFKKSRIGIRNETVLVTRLDGINVNTNQETSLYKCYLCGKLFNYLSKVQCHLSMHFEKDIVIYQCELCKSSFWFKNQVMQHIRRKHPEEAKQEAAANAVRSMTKNSEADETSNSDMDSGIQLKSEPADDHSDSINSDSIDNAEKEDSAVSCGAHDQINEKDLFQAEDANGSLCRFWRGLKYRKNVNGSYVCLVCRKSFHREISLLKHIKIHSTHKMCYCQECGKGFSDYSMLKQHLAIYHNKSDTQKPHIKPVTKSTLLSNLLRKTAEDPQTGQDPVSEEIAQVEKAREFLMKEGIQEDVTVVMPCGPEDEPRMDSSPMMETENVWSEKDSEDSQGSNGIQAAPKRSLIPEVAPTKSKRKSSQPVKLNSEDSVRSSPPLSATPVINGTEMNNNSMPGEIKIKQEPLSPCSESPPPVTKSQMTPSQANPHVAQFLMAQGTVVNPALNSFILANSSSTTGVPQPTMLLSNSFLPQIASAGGIPGIPMNQVMMPVSVQVPNGEKSQMPGSKEPSPSPVPSTSAEPSPALSGSGSSSEREQLVGFPRVQWSPSDGAASGNWQWNTIATDGRKVTSLSRTHSRLPIVNAPVNRDKVCKPTQLSDGRQVYRCPFCSKDFLSYSDINRHMDFHEDIRPYKCKYCDYYARTNSQLKVHMMRHQGIREFCCKVCNYKGVTQSDLNRHMKSQIHILKSRNECADCGEGFVTPKNLEKHHNGNCIVKVQKLEYADVKIEVTDT